MGGKQTKEPPKEEVKKPSPPPVRQKNRPTDGAVGGQTLRPGTEKSATRTNDATSELVYSRSENILDDATSTQYRSYRARYSKSATDLDRLRERPRKLTHTVIQRKTSSALLVAAIDFGTTYSGYAYSFIKTPNEILTNYWENTAMKTPTVVLMDPQKRFHSFGDEARRDYEQLMKTGAHKKWYLFERFKMKLFVKETPLQKDVEIEDILGKPMKAIDVFTEAIRYIKEHLEGVLNDPTRESHVPIQKDTDIRWVLTVPAIWNDLSKKFMREAAKNAGIPDDMLLLALEPEAASVFCKRELGIDRVPVGCRYLVLDLGGGTADITCHEVNVDGTLKELHPPTGGDFGGTTVDNSFINILNRIFGGDIIKRFKTYYTNEYWELMSDFEIKKRKFDGSGRVVLKFPVRMLELYEDDVGETVEETLMYSTLTGHVEFKQGKMFMTENLMEDIFNSAVAKIKDKTSELLEKVDNIDCILLVGGFSESLYLQNVMKQNFDNLIVLPKEPAGAVLKGAVIYGHETKAISSRKCSYTYGIARMIKFDPEKHPEKKKVRMDKFTYCDDAFNKHIEVGTDVSVNTPEKAKAHEYFPAAAEQRQAVLEVYKTKKRNPVFIDEDGCEFVGLIRVDIDPRGDIWSKLMVKLIFGGTELIIEVKDVKNGSITTGSVDFLG
ncbi:heat shock 70 kDa protein 12A-like isoform X2 [Mercenaria mercenaria]|uniref:heat shock 70 kDa protein 12A-like isoform X2 n=1 Tax=Mercenaria mercenaria TaxID=6596 RepID=UPI00234EE5C8|nr:heat shock 70 kDa protein 12A-like isoform X2 [Mercenaria mercenaria]